ncbi:MAG TPA: adenylate/guanylate cyclase domain-containing protein [Roseiarcus sp.]|nr:adenylate/guanylate cyclase domain-containing protein [Roseiarcus sp.]
MAEARKLAAILAADVVGFSRLAGADEERTLARLRALWSDLVDPTIAVHRGRVVKRTGDGALVEFRSVVDAVRCAVEIQDAMVERNAGVEPDRRIEFRIGIHLGDVVEESDGDLMGDGVNIAARLEGVAEPGAICLSEDAYRQVKARLDLRVSDLGERRLKNIAEPLRVYSLAVGRAAKAAPRAPPAPERSPAAPETPSIAVLPFQNMGGDPAEDFFCDGLVEDIITTLSKLAGMRVIARNSTFVYKGKHVDVREAASQLGARYVLEGSVRRAGNRVRITVQLIDAKDGAHLWAERYDRSVDDIFAIQDEITLVLATELQVKLTEGEQARLRYTTTSNVAAWTEYARGRAYMRERVDKESVGAARAHFEKALALDPDSASLTALVAFAHVLDARFGWWDSRGEAIRKAQARIDRALELDRDNADAHICLSYIHAISERFDDAAREARRAVELAPGSADMADLASLVLTSCGNPEEAAGLSEKAIALSPHYPPMYLGVLGHAYHHSGRVEEAIAAFKEYHARSRGFGLVDLVIVCQQNGRPEEAKEAVRALLAARKTFTIAAWAQTQFRRDKARLAADLDALRAAGLPEG